MVDTAGPCFMSASFWGGVLQTRGLHWPSNNLCWPNVVPGVGAFPVGTFPRGWKPRLDVFLRMRYGDVPYTCSVWSLTLIAPYAVQVFVLLEAVM